MMVANDRLEAMVTGFAGPSWIDKHRRAWVAKPGLRHFYEKEYFARLVSMLPEGRSLEIGSGPGFFAEYHRASVVTDIHVGPHVDSVADVHNLPFASGAFQAIAGIDVLHHFARPLAALTELSRVLAPGGRLLLIEPWLTFMSRFFYRYIHHEDVSPIVDRLGRAFPEDKDPMDGNSAIPLVYLQEMADSLPRHCQLKIRSIEPFGLFGYLATGGFTRIYFGQAVTRASIAVDRLTPRAIRARSALKAFIVAEKVA